LYVHTQTPGGSSSGSAVALTAGFSPLSIGTETAGSAVYPAGTNGLYCIKCTLGSVPTDGMFKLSHCFDGVGPMARDPEDLAALMTAIMKEECVPAPADGGFAKAMEKGFEALRIGVMDVEWGTGEDWGKHWRSEEAVGSLS
jgi:amidase